ncbi:MAG: hypothetical protein RMJ43_16115 [Chloroherpetonaceae bacterium]|nr:hypothetical protein [Chthonomonadaceae bacterium]MDW8209359.1 hypothetical protein [Chloroherpetonaceae bacterium]
MQPQAPHALPSALRYVVGAIGGLMVAVAGIQAWRALTLATTRRFDAFGVLIGALIGIVVRAGVRTGGRATGLLAGFLTLLTLLSAHYFIIRDHLTRVAQAQGYRGVSHLPVLSALRLLDFWGWVLMALAVSCGYRCAHRAILRRARGEK